MKLLVAAAAALLTAFSPAQAQGTFPSKTVRLIVPVVPGSFTDVAARALAGELSASLGHPVVVENRPGAGTTLGTAIVAQAEPDGHTLLVTENSFTISPRSIRSCRSTPRRTSRPSRWWPKRRTSCGPVRTWA